MASESCRNLQLSARRSPIGMGIVEMSARDNISSDEAVKGDGAPRTPSQAVAHAQAIAGRYTANNPESSVEAFLDARRAGWSECPTSPPSIETALAVDPAPSSR
jgi:hypothetical protein